MSKSLPDFDFFKETVSTLSKQWRRCRKERDVSNPGWWLQLLTVAETPTKAFLYVGFTFVKQLENFFFFKRHLYQVELKTEERSHTQGGWEKGRGKGGRGMLLDLRAGVGRWEERGYLF
jgi:hypothetical protein